MGEREAEPVAEYSSVLQALRIPGDEVQFGECWRYAQNQWRRASSLRP